MKYFLFIVCLGAVLCGARADDILIDSRFADTSLAPVSAELPLRAPRGINIQPGATTVTAGTKSMEGWEPPYLLIETGGLTANPKYPAWASVFWDLEKLKLSSGKYELSWKVLPLLKGFHGASMSVSLLSADGKSLQQLMPPETAPLRVAFTDKGRIRIGEKLEGGESQPYEIAGTCDFLMTFDLDEKLWSVSVNGLLLADQLPFDAKLLETRSGFLIKNVMFMGTGVPESAVALADVKLVKKATPAP